MKNKINIHNFWRSDAFIILMFAMMSVVSSIVVWHSHYVGVSGDLSFHWKRIYEIHDSILQGNIIPKVSLNTFNQTGSAVMSLYPNLNIYSMAFLSFFIKSFVNLYYLIWVLRNLLSLVIGYYACRSFTNNKKISFIFSVVYTLSTVTLYFQKSTLLGMSSSVIFMPLVLFGFFNLLEKNDWIELTLGMSAITLCHVLDTIFIGFLLLSLLLINIKSFFEKDKVKSLLKFMVVTFMIVSFFSLSFFVLMINNQISNPSFPFPLLGEPLKSIGSSLLNHIGPHISIFSFLGLLICFLRYKKISFYNKQILWLAILFIFVSSNLFPWRFLNHTFFNIIQFPWRLVVVPELLLSYLFSVLIIEICNTKKEKIIMLIFVTMVALLTQLMGQLAVISNSQNYKELSHSYNGKDTYIISNNLSFNHLMDGYSIWQYDYYPKQSVKKYETINHHLATYDGNKHIKMKLLGNGGYEFSNKARIKDLFLPFLYYNGVNYQVKLDGKTVNGFANKNSLMTIKNVSKGHHHIRIIVHNTKMQIVSYITSLIGLIILLFAIFRKYIMQ